LLEQENAQQETTLLEVWFSVLNVQRPTSKSRRLTWAFNVERWAFPP